MAVIDKIVTVNISKESMAVAVASFGIPLIITQETSLTSGFIVKEYSSIDEVITDFAPGGATYKAASNVMGQTPKVRSFLIGYASTASLLADMTAIVNTRNDWYCALPIDYDDAEAISIADYIETSNKIAIHQTTDPASLTTATGTLADQFAAKSYKRNALIYHSASATGEYANCAWAGRLLPYEPGAATWSYKTLAGITVDNINGDQLTNAQAKKLNVYMAIGGVNTTIDGRAPGEWIDITIGIDFMHARIQERIFGLLVGSAKIPYNDAGITAVTSALNSVLTLAAQRQIIEQSSISISAPLYADLQASQPAMIEGRHLPDVNFSATLIGAIHSVQINGTVSV